MEGDAMFNADEGVEIALSVLKLPCVIVEKLPYANDDCKRVQEWCWRVYERRLVMVNESWCVFEEGGGDGGVLLIRINCSFRF